MVPIDPLGPIANDPTIGPITDLEQVAKILDVRAGLGVTELDQDVEVGGFIALFGDVLERGQVQN